MVALGGSLLLSNVILFIFQRLYQIFGINAKALGVGVQVIGKVGHFVGDHLESVNDGDAELMCRICDGGVDLANVPKGELNGVEIAAPNGGNDVKLRLGEKL